MLDLTIVTGMSGAGRSSAADALEDLGFFVIDNLPPALIPKVAELAAGGGRPSRYALVVDVRSVREVADLSGYDALILGSAIRAGRPLPEVVRSKGTSPEASHDTAGG